MGSGNDLEAQAENPAIEDIALLTEPDEIDEVKQDLKEISDAVKDVTEESSIDSSFEGEYVLHHANQEYSSPDISKYWARDEEEFSTSYSLGYRTNADLEPESIIVSQQTRDYNNAVRANFNARMRNEFGLFLPDAEESFDEKERNMMFKALNPGLWKFMYDASAYMVFSGR